MSKPTTHVQQRRSSRLILLRRIGLQIHSDLHRMEKPVEWLSFKSGVARSSIREIIAGRSNPRLLTLDAIAKGLGYRGVIAFLYGVEAALGHEASCKDL